MATSLNNIFDILKEPAPVVDSDGCLRWYNNNGQLHRDNDKPAVIYKNGSRHWYQNSDLHRENGLPAVMQANGIHAWYHHGKYIRQTINSMDITT